MVGKERGRKDELISYTKGERQIEMDEKKEKEKTERSREISSSSKKKKKGKEGNSSVPGLELLGCMNACTPLLHLPFSYFPFFPSLSSLALSSIIHAITESRF